MSDGFVPGFASRRDAAATALGSAFPVAEPFVARAPGAAAQPRGFAPAAEGGGPRHFSPRDRDADPTAGWNPFDATTDAAGDPQGFVDPLAAARAAGHAEGYAAALAEAAADAGRDRALAEALGQALGRGVAFDRDLLARQLRETILHLVGRLVGEVGVSGELLSARIESGVDLLADATESALLRVHPADVALLEGRLPATLFAVGDPAIARGSFVLESASSIVEDGPAAWLDQLAQAVDRVALPAC